MNQLKIKVVSSILYWIHLFHWKNKVLCWLDLKYQPLLNSLFYGLTYSSSCSHSSLLSSLKHHLSLFNLKPFVINSFWNFTFSGMSPLFLLVSHIFIYLSIYLRSTLHISISSFFLSLHTALIHNQSSFNIYNQISVRLSMLYLTQHLSFLLSILFFVIHLEIAILQRAIY